MLEIVIKCIIEMVLWYLDNLYLKNNKSKKIYILIVNIVLKSINLDWYKIKY